jgi:hypothetical protein
MPHQNTFIFLKSIIPERKNQLIVIAQCFSTAAFSSSGGTKPAFPD